jgi:hypothetical protein
MTVSKATVFWTFRSGMVSIIIAAWFSLYPILNRPGNVISWDVFGYYLYLPAHFIYNDGDLSNPSWIEHINNQYHNSSSIYQLVPIEGGKNLIKYSLGMAVVYAPGFFIAHHLANSLGYPADGFSSPYQWAMIITHFLALILAFPILARALRHYFSDTVVGLCLFLIAFGTNYLVTAGDGIGMTHSFAFLMFSLILLQSISYHLKASPARAFFLGLSIGFVTLVRPSDFIICLIPLLWGVQNRNDLRTKFKDIYQTRKKHLILVLVGGFIAGFPQLVYWKRLTGDWLFYSYVNPGEGMDFLQPYLIQVLFSFRKGWLIYTPLMIFVFVGLFKLRKTNPRLFIPVLVFFILNLYLVSSWSCWWYADSFGQRAMVDSYAVLAIPLCAFLDWVFSLKSAWKKFAWGIIGILLIALNVFQSWQVLHGIIHSSRMTGAAFAASFGKVRPVDRFDELLLMNHDMDPYQLLNDTSKLSERTIHLDSFEKIQHSDINIVSTKARSGKQTFSMDSSTLFSPPFKLAYSSLTQKEYALVYATGWVFLNDSLKIPKLSLIASFKHNGKEYRYAGKDFDKQGNYKTGWNKFALAYLTPEVRRKSDELNVYFWLREPGSTPVQIDDFHIRVFEPN